VNLAEMFWPQLVLHGGLALLAGAILPFAFAPYDQAWVFLISWPLLILLLDQCAKTGHPRRRAAMIGWLFGIGQFTAGLYWIGAAFFVEAEIFAAIMPFAIAALAMGLGLFPMLAAVLAISIWQQDYRRVVGLALTYTLMEWLRGHILTGFPWNLPGHVFAFSSISLQSASLLGPDGLSALAILIAGMPVMLLDRPVLSRSVIIPLGLVISLALGLGLYGAIRLPAQPVDKVDGVRLRLVQPVTDLAQKWNSQYTRAIFSNLMNLSALPPTGAEPTHLFWPEAAPPFILSESPNGLAAIADQLKPGRHLITGAVRIDRDLDGRLAQFYNSLQVVDDQARLLASYDKVHLVPFGEYLPARDLFDWIGLRAIAAHFGPSAPGNGAMVLFAPGLPPFRPLICYESIFADEIMPGSGARPGFLLVATDTAWFGLSIGPAQHFAQARMRAVENGLPLVQVANAGISGVIDPFGRVTSMIGLGQRGMLDADLPVAIDPPMPLPLPILLGIFGLLAMRRIGPIRRPAPPK
jgi:apolipoprotein N-acyltransferase